MAAVTPHSNDEDILRAILEKSTNKGAIAQAQAALLENVSNNSRKTNSVLKKAGVSSEDAEMKVQLKELNKRLGELRYIESVRMNSEKKIASEQEKAAKTAQNETNRKLNEIKYIEKVKINSQKAEAEAIRKAAEEMADAVRASKSALTFKNISKEVGLQIIGKMSPALEKLIRKNTDREEKYHQSTKRNDIKVNTELNQISDQMKINNNFMKFIATNTATTNKLLNTIVKNGIGSGSGSGSGGLLAEGAEAAGGFALLRSLGPALLAMAPAIIGIGAALYGGTESSTKGVNKIDDFAHKNIPGLQGLDEWLFKHTGGKVGTPSAGTPDNSPSQTVEEAKQRPVDAKTSDVSNDINYTAKNITFKADIISFNGSPVAGGGTGTGGIPMGTTQGGSLTSGPGNLGNGVANPASRFTSGGATVASGNLAKNQHEAYQAFKDLGYSDQAARVAVANLSGESLKKADDIHPDPSRSNPNQKAHGIASWDDARSERIRKQFGKMPNEMSVTEQAKAFDWESKNFYKKTYDALHNDQLSPEQQMSTVVSNFEGSANQQKDIGIRMGHYNGFDPNKRQQASGPGEAGAKQNESPNQITARLQSLKNAGLISNEQCVSLAAASVGLKSGQWNVHDWKKGEGAQEGTLKAGTPVATFLNRQGQQSDKYAGGGSGTPGAHLDHAGVFQSYIKDKNGNNIGMNISEQYQGSHGIHTKPYYFNHGWGEGNASNYSAIKTNKGYLGGKTNPMSPQDPTMGKQINLEKIEDGSIGNISENLFKTKMGKQINLQKADDGSIGNRISDWIKQPTSWADSHFTDIQNSYRNQAEKHDPESRIGAALSAMKPSISQGNIPSNVFARASLGMGDTSYKGITPDSGLGPRRYGKIDSNSFMNPKIGANLMDSSTNDLISSRKPSTGGTTNHITNNNNTSSDKSDNPDKFKGSSEPVDNSERFKDLWGMGFYTGT